MKNYKIVDAYDSISATVNNADNYFRLWKQYQSLWDLQSTQIYDMLGDQVDKWTQLLNEIRSGRKTFDGSDDKKVFGAIAISYGAVKGDVTTKYDLWHKEILKKFGNQVAIAMKALKKEIFEARGKLETLSIDASDDVTTFVTEIQDIRRKVKGWEKGIQRMRKGEALLKGQRFQFPNDWPWLSVLEYEWSESFQQILNKRVTTMEEQIPVLQQKILNEEKICNAKIKEIETEWEHKRPRTAEFTPKEAIDQLNIMGKRIEKVNEEWIRICKAKELLDMELSDPERLTGLVEDHQLLKQVWSEIYNIWQRDIDEINQTPFYAF